TGVSSRYRETKKSATAYLRRSNGVFVRNRYCPLQAPPAENCLQFFRGLKTYITHVFVMLPRMWSSEARGSTCAAIAVGRGITHVLVDHVRQDITHYVLSDGERLQRAQRRHTPP